MSTGVPRLRASAAIAAATASAPSERAVVSDGTNTFTVEVDISAHDLVEAFRRHTAVHGLVDHDRGRAGAVPKAVDRLEREAAVGGRLVEVDAEPLARMRLELARAHRLAGLGPAQVQRMLSDRVRPEEVVERDDAVDLGAGEIQHLGDDAHRAVRNVPELVLDRVQNRQEGARLRGPGLG